MKRTFPSGTSLFDITEALYHLIDERFPRRIKILVTFEVIDMNILCKLTGSGTDSNGQPFNRPLKESDGITVNVVNASDPNISYEVIDAANGRLTGGADGSTGQLRFFDSNQNQIGNDSQAFTFGSSSTTEGTVTSISVEFTPEV